MTEQCDEQGVPTSVREARRADQPWRAKAACRGIEAEELFPDARYKQRRAADFCREVCTVKEACLEHAIAADERHGVWGGMTEAQRRREVVRRAAGGAA